MRRFKVALTIEHSAYSQSSLGNVVGSKLHAFSFIHLTFVEAKNWLVLRLRIEVARILNGTTTITRIWIWNVCRRVERWVLWVHASHHDQFLTDDFALKRSRQPHVTGWVDTLWIVARVVFLRVFTGTVVHVGILVVVARLWVGTAVDNGDQRRGLHERRGVATCVKRGVETLHRQFTGGVDQDGFFKVYPAFSSQLSNTMANGVEMVSPSAA